MAVDYATLKKGGFMRQKQKNNFPCGWLCRWKSYSREFTDYRKGCRKIRRRTRTSDFPSECGNPIYQT